jgi:putative ABC transport system permease protein
MLTRTIRNVFRSWRRTPGLAVGALLTLSLGVGFNAAVFSVVHAVLFRPLPYPASERLVELVEVDPAARGFRVSVLNYVSWAERTKQFEAMAAFNGVSFNVTGDTEAERVSGAAITASLFRVLALPPLSGRALQIDDQRPGSRRVALIAQSFWQRRYGGDPAIIGTTIALSGERHEIVGIVPDAFRDVGRSRASSAPGPQIFVPLTIDAARENRGNRVMRVVGRLRPDASLDRARDELRGVSAAMAREFPASNSGWSARVDSVYDTMLDEGVRPSLLALLGAVALVMLIACANVSNLILAKAIGRQRELALRTALGAEPRRLFRQLLTESLCLAVVSGLIGIWISVVAVEALRSLLPPALPRITEVRVDMVVLGFGLLVSLLSGIIFGLLPAIRVSRVDPLEVMAGGRRGVTGRPSRALHQTMVAVQVALATTLLVGSVLLLQSFVRLQRVALGFAPEGVLTARVGLPRAAYADAGRVRAFYERLLQSLDSNAGIQSAAVATSAPFGSGVRRNVPVGARTTTAVASSVSVVEHIVSGSYFRTLSIPIVAGRVFEERERTGSPLVVVISQATADRLWPRGDAIGQQFDIEGRLHEVVGVAGDVRGDEGRGATGGGRDRQPPPAVYLSAAQSPQPTMTVLLRTSSGPSRGMGATNDAAALAVAFRKAIREIDPALPADQVRPLDEWVAEAAAQPRLTTVLAGAFAGMALLLAAIGIYAVAAYSVGQRRPEIGLRMALGATRRQILTMVLRSGLTAAALGMSIGLAGALFINTLLAGLFFEVRPEDPLAFGSVAAMLGTVAIVACYVPARRATRVDPLVTLRCE